MKLCTALTALIMTALLAVSQGLQAAPASDRSDQPITIEADRMQYNNANQTNVFSGNVVLTQGGFEIKAQKLEVREDAAGNQFATASGNPATFRRQIAGQPDRVEGSGRELRYANQSNTLEILQAATLRRVNGTQVSDEVYGAKIVYQGDRDFFTVEGGKQGDGGRVRVVIQPRSTGETKPANGATLQPSRSLAR